MKLLILHEDDDLLVVDKPPFWAVTEEGSGVTRTVVGYLREKYGQTFWPVHRLDNTTSGLLVVAKSQPTYDSLRKIWNSGEVIKEYTALVVGAITEETAIQTPIAHHPSRKNRMTICGTPALSEELHGQEAFTIVKRLSIHSCRQKFYSLVSVTIKTGVRHQIRVHLAGIGHPLAGDKLYQNTSKRREDVLGLARPFLHASRVELPHPGTQARLQSLSELAFDLKKVLEKLGKR